MSTSVGGPGTPEREEGRERGQLHFGGGWSVPAAGTLLSCQPLARPFLRRFSRQARGCPTGDPTANPVRTCLPSSAGSSATGSPGSAIRSGWRGPAGAGSEALGSGGSGGAGAPGASVGDARSGAGAEAGAAPRRSSSQASSSANAVASAGSAASNSAGASIAQRPPSARPPGPRGSPPRPATRPRPEAEFPPNHAPSRSQGALESGPWEAAVHLSLVDALGHRLCSCLLNGVKGSLFIVFRFGFISAVCKKYILEVVVQTSDPRHSKWVGCRSSRSSSGTEFWAIEDLIS